MSIPRFEALTIPAPEFRPVRRKATGKLTEVSPWINANVREHRMSVVKKTAAWRALAAELAAGIPPFTGPVRIVARIVKSRGGIYDPNNLNPTTKAIVDGLVEAGLLPADDYHHVIGPDHRHGGKGRPEVRLEITALDDESSLTA